MDTITRLVFHQTFWLFHRKIQCNTHCTKIWNSWLLSYQADLWNTGILPENAYVANSYQKLIWIGIQTMGCICYIKEFGSLYYRCEYSLVILAWHIPKWYLFIYLLIYLFIDILSTTHYKCTVNFSGMPYIILKSGNLWLILIEVGRLFHNKLRRKISKFRS